MKFMGALGVGAAAVMGELFLPRHGWGVPITVIGILGALLVVDAVRVHQPADPRPWYLLALSQLAPALGMSIQHAMDRPALFLPAASHVLTVIGMVSSVVAFALFVRARTRVLDRYQLLDLAIFVVSAAVAISQLVLEPAMDASPPVGISRGLSTTYILMMLVTLVLVIRFVTLPGRRGRAVWYLLATTATIVVGSVVANATATASGGGWRISWTLTICVAMTVAAARHESMRRLTEPAEGETPTFGTLRLLGLGVALLLMPLTAVLVHLRTDELSVFTFLVPPAVVTALVMARLRLLFSRERAAREEVVASREAFSALVHGISDVITVVDEHGVIIYATESSAKALGRPAEELTGQLLQDLVHTDDTCMIREMLETLPGSGRTIDSVVRVQVEDAERFFELEAADRMDNASVHGLIVVLHDVTTRHTLERKLRHQASHDGLTSLPNRDFLAEQIEANLRSGCTTSVLFIDLDDFKDVNDGLGHHAGDVLLGAVAARLKHAARGSDTVARLGGDEFAIVVTGDDHVAARDVAHRVLEVLEGPFEVLGQRVCIGASIGLATSDGGTVQDLLRQADVAMYRAKASGKGTLVLFEAGMDEAAIERLWLHTDLADSIGRGELRLFFQPIVDLGTGEVRIAEGLVRWEHPTLGLLSPDHFMSLAEDTGLIVPLGRWVLNEACRHAATWPDEIGVSVNLSSRQLEDPSLLEDVAHVLHVNDIRPSRLVLDVTESLIMQNMEPMVECLADLRALGVRVAVDDFGTGYSSLSSLTRLPLDMLKIDSSFVATMLDRPDASALVKVVVDMGRTLGLEVVAEGIELPEQAAELHEHRCQMGQGFLYSPPVPADEFHGLVRGRIVTPILNR